MKDDMIISGARGGGKTLAQAEWIVADDTIPDDAILPDHFGDWAGYFFGNRPMTKADLREVLEGKPRPDEADEVRP